MFFNIKYEYNITLKRTAPAVMYDHTVVWYWSHTHSWGILFRYRSTIPSVRCRQIDIYCR